MMGRGLIVGAALVVAGCSQQVATLNLDDVATQRLFQMPSPQYYATLAIANQVATNCARYSYNTEVDVLMNEERNKVGRGSLSAAGLRGAIDLEQDVSERAFSAKHGVELGAGADLCPAADAEALEASAMSAVLTPNG